MKTDIFILTKCTDGLVYRAIKSIAATACMQDIGKVAVGYTGESEDEIKKIEETLASYRLQYAVEKLEYNFAKDNNFLVKKHAQSEAVLFMNDDVELIDDCIGECLTAVSRPDVGTAGVKLLYRDKTVQHAGIYIIESAAEHKFLGVGHICQHKPDTDMKAAYTAGSTGAFLMLRRQLFDQLGGFDEHFNVCFEDVLLNIRAIAAGKKNITFNNVRAWHDESQTRGKDIDARDIIYIANEYNKIRDSIASRAVGWLVQK